MSFQVRLENVHLNLKSFKSTDMSLRRLLVEQLMLLIGRGQRQQSSEGTNILKGLNLEIGEGVRLGLIGENGAGKSTILRLIAGIYLPTAGRVQVRGRVTTLLNTGFCLDNQLTGMENLRLGCALLNIPKSEMKRKMDEIIEFSELEDSIHKHLEYFSDGMRSRLGFAIATSVQPEILLIDEAIGTGDKFFIEKATQRINEMMSNAEILVMASHNESIMRSLCNQVALVRDGRIAATGGVDEMLGNYTRAA